MTRLPAKILVVDDDPDVLASVCLLLRKNRFEVFEARTGQECLEKLPAIHPDLVLLDVMLPDLNGVEVLRRVRSTPAYDDVFIVHLSAQVAPAERKMEGLELGADGYVSQPVEDHELLVRVQAFLRHKAALDALRASEARYRTLFESNPEPMWVCDKQTLQIVAVNRAAVQNYGYPSNDFIRLSLFDLIPEAQHQELMRSVQKPSSHGTWQHRLKSGEVRDVETHEQDIHWLDQPSRIVLAHDVTERNRIEQERIRQLERLSAEFRSLGRLSLDRSAESEDERHIPLRDRAIELYRPLASRYEQLLLKAHETRVYKTEEGVSAQLRALASDLVELGATARDIIEIHYQTLRKSAPSPELPRSQALIETGRMNLIEILGYLVTAYRRRCHPLENLNGKL